MISPGLNVRLTGQGLLALVAIPIPWSALTLTSPLYKTNMAKRANLRVKRSSRPSFGSNHDVDRNVVITSSVRLRHVHRYRVRVTEPETQVSSRPSGVPPTTLRPIIFITDAPGVKRDAQRPKKSLKGFRTRQTTDLQSSPCVSANLHQRLG